MFTVICTFISFYLTYNIWTGQIHKWIYFDDPHSVGKTLTYKFWIKFWIEEGRPLDLISGVEADFGTNLWIPKWNSKLRLLQKYDISPSLSTVMLFQAMPVSMTYIRNEINQMFTVKNQNKSKLRFKPMTNCADFYWFSFELRCSSLMIMHPIRISNSTECKIVCWEAPYWDSKWND